MSLRRGQINSARCDNGATTLVALDNGALLVLGTNSIRYVTKTEHFDLAASCGNLESVCRIAENRFLIGDEVGGLHVLDLQPAEGASSLLLSFNCLGETSIASCLAYLGRSLCDVVLNILFICILTYLLTNLRHRRNRRRRIRICRQ